MAHRIVSRALALILSLITVFTVAGSAATSEGCVMTGELVDVTVEIMIDGAWLDITADVRTTSPINITRGIANEGGRADPGEMSLLINNGTSNINGVVGRYSLRNARSDLYGKLARNTPIRVSAGLVGGTQSVRGVWEIASLPVRWDVSGQDVWAPLTAAGITRRLGIPSKTRHDPVSRLARAYGAHAYWPMDAPEGSVTAPEVLGGGGPVRTANSTEEMLYGRGFLAKYLPGAPLSGPASGTVEAPVVNGPSGGAILDLAVRTTPPSEWASSQTPQIHEAAIDTDGAVNIRFAFNIVSGALAAGIVNLDTSTTIVSDSATVNIEDGRLHHIRLSAVEAAGTDATVTVALDGVEVASATGAIGATVIPSVRWVKAANSAFGNDSQPITFGRLILWPADTSTLAQAYAAYSGHAGEPAGQRVERICAEEGIASFAHGAMEETVPMGAQYPSTPLEAMDEAADTEAAGSRLAILYETRDALGLTFRSRRSYHVIS